MTKWIIHHCSDCWSIFPNDAAVDRHQLHNSNLNQKCLPPPGQRQKKPAPVKAETVERYVSFI